MLAEFVKITIRDCWECMVFFVQSDCVVCAVCL